MEAILPTIIARIPVHPDGTSEFGRSVANRSAEFCDVCAVCLYITPNVSMDVLGTSEGTSASNLMDMRSRTDAETIGTSTTVFAQMTFESEMQSSFGLACKGVVAPATRNSSGI